jgi:hypothetical protein
MSRRAVVTAGALVALSLGSVLTTQDAFATNFMNWMNPSKWFGGKGDRYRDDYGYGHGGPGYGYGGPGYGYGGPGYGYGGPGYGWGGPGYGVPGYGYGVPGYGYGGPGYGYGGPGYGTSGYDDRSRPIR